MLAKGCAGWAARGPAAARARATAAEAKRWFGMPRKLRRMGKESLIAASDADQADQVRSIGAEEHDIARRISGKTRVAAPRAVRGWGLGAPRALSRLGASRAAVARAVADAGRFPGPRRD